MVSSWTHERTTGLISDYVREQVLADVRGLEESKVLERTQVIRDHNGRVIGLDSTGSDTSQDGLVLYSYDDAGQLVGARSASHVWEWEYKAGVMMRERVFALDTSNGSERSAADSRVLEGERIFTHNEANQLVTVEARAYAGARGDAGELAAHNITEYTYNLAGERSGEVTTDKLTGASYSREYSWGAYGGLTSVTDSVSSRVGISRTSLISDAVGEVSAVSDGEGITVPLMWDARSDIPHLLGAGATSAPSSDGGFSQAGIPGGVTPWHTLNVPGLTGNALDSALGSTPGLPTDWGVPSASATPVPGMPTGFEFTGAGSLRVAGLDMLGARVYDSPSRRFLSTDPKAAIAGSSWFADVYAYAGNNPLEYVDPRGERPMTVADYRKYQSQEGERFMQQSLRLLALVGVIGSLFIAPTSILLAGGVGFISGAANGAADGMDFHTPDGNIDWDKVQAYALQEGGKEALTAALIGMLFKAGPPVARATGNQAMKVPVISRTVDRVKTSPVVIKTQNTVNAVKTRINGIQDRIATWTRTSLLGIEHVVPKVHPTPHNSPHQIDIPNGPKPTHTGSLDHRTSGTVHEPNVQLKPVEGPKVENLPPAKGVTGDSPSLEKPTAESREMVRPLKDKSGIQPIETEIEAAPRPVSTATELKSSLEADIAKTPRQEMPAEVDGKRIEYYRDREKFKTAETDYFTSSPEEQAKKSLPKFTPWGKENVAPDRSTELSGLVGKNREDHRILEANEYQGMIPSQVKDGATHIWKEGDIPRDGEWRKLEKPKFYNNEPENGSSGNILPTKDVNGNGITYTEYNAIPRAKHIQENGKAIAPQTKHRIIVGSNGSMYYSPDHYHTFIRLIG